MSRRLVIASFVTVFAASAAIAAEGYGVAPTAVGGYAVAPTSVEGYTVAPTSIDGYNDRRQVADISAPQPLPPRFYPQAAPVAPAPQIVPAPVGPAAKSGAARPVAAKPRPAPARKAKPEPESADKQDEEKPEAASEEIPHHVAIDVSVAPTTRRQIVTTVGATAAVGGPLEKSGVRVHAESQGIWSCCIGTPKDSPLPQGVQLSNAALVGYEIVGEKGTIAGYVGVDVQNTPAAIDGLSRLRTTRVGVQVSGDVYYTPTDKTMISSNMSFSSNKLAYFMRTKFGVAIADDIYVGPEVGAIGNRDNQQYRAGAHVSGVKIGQMTFGFAAGYAKNRKAGDGAYAIIDSRIVF